MSLNIDALLEQLAGQLLPVVLNELVGGLTGLLGGLFGKRQTVDAILTSLIGGVVNQLTSELFGQVLTGLLGGLFGKRELMDTLTTLGNEALGHLTSILTSLVNTGLAAVLTTLNAQGKRGILDDIQSVFASVVSTLGQTGTALLGAVQPHIDQLTTELAAQSLNAAQSLLGTLAAISGTLQGKRGLFDEILGGLSASVSSVVSQLLATGSLLIDAVQPHIDDLTTQLTIHGLNAAESLLGTLAAISGTLQGKRGVWDDLMASLSGTWDSFTTQLGQVGSGLVEAVTPHLQDLQDQLITHGLNAAQSLLGTLAGISGTLQG